MARKTDYAKRERLSAEAFEVICARGVHRTSMSDIASALGMKRPTLYWYFRDLGQIFDAVVKQTERSLQAYIVARLADIDDPIEYLQAFTDAHFDFYQPRRGLIIALFQLWAVSGSDDPDRILRRGTRFIEPMRVGLIARLQDAVDDGLINECEPEAVIDLLLATIDGALVHSVTRDTDLVKIRRAVRQLVFAPLTVTD